MKECSFGERIAWMVSHNSRESSCGWRSYVWFSVRGQGCKQPDILSLGSLASEAGGPGAPVSASRCKDYSKFGKCLRVSSQRGLKQGGGTCDVLWPAHETSMARRWLPRPVTWRCGRAGWHTPIRNGCLQADLPTRPACRKTW